MDVTSGRELEEVRLEAPLHHLTHALGTAQTMTWPQNQVDSSALMHCHPY